MRYINSARPPGKSQYHRDKGWHQSPQDGALGLYLVTLIAERPHWHLAGDARLATGLL